MPIYYSTLRKMVQNSHELIISTIVNEKPNVLEFKRNLKSISNYNRLSYTIRTLSKWGRGTYFTGRIRMNDTISFFMP